MKKTSIELDEAEKALFKKKVKMLSEFHGSNTELISLYIPENADRSTVTGQLTAEISQSSNIKDPKTRKNVQGALKRIINFLKQIDFKIPENGLVVFAGNISNTPGVSDIKLFTVRPIKNLTVKLYWCDSEFHLDPLLEMLEPESYYAIITLDKNEATLALLHGKKYDVIGHFTSRVPGKIRAGGQSAQRFARLREEAEHDFYKEVSEKANTAFLPFIDKLKGLIVSGPGLTKQDFLAADLVDYRLKQKVLGTIDTSYTDASGIRETINKATDLLRNTEIMHEKELLQKFFAEVAKNALAVYGIKETREALSYGKVSELILSEALEKILYKLKCLNCNEEIELIEDIKKPIDESSIVCSKCKGKVELIEEADLIEALSEEATKISAKTTIVSMDTEEGKQFLESFGGIGALLRFK